MTQQCNGPDGKLLDVSSQNWSGPSFVCHGKASGHHFKYTNGVFDLGRREAVHGWHYVCRASLLGIVGTSLILCYSTGADARLRLSGAADIVYSQQETSGLYHDSVVSNLSTSPRVF